MTQSAAIRPIWLILIGLLLIVSFVLPRAYGPSLMVTPFLLGMALVGVVGVLVRPVFPAPPAVWLVLLVAFALLGASTNTLMKWALVAAAAAAWVAISIGREFNTRPALMRACLMAIVLGMALNVLVAWLQFFDLEHWLYPFVSENASHRPYGNLRQPNHLATFSVFGLVSLWWFYQKDLIGRRALVSGVLLAYSGVALSGSRVGILEVVVASVLFAVWTGPNRRFELLLFTAGPLWVLGMIEALQGMATLMGIDIETFKERGGDSVSTRFVYWGEAWSLALKHPSAGVGWGELGKARFLEEPVALGIENTVNAHNLVLQLLAEMGFASTFAILAPVVWVLIGARHAMKSSVDARWALLMIVGVGLHSMLEYPLWYMNFIVPSAFAFGVLMAVDKKEGEGRGIRVAPHWTGIVVSGILILSSALVLIDYVRVASAFQENGKSVENREKIRSIQNTPLFRYYADRTLVERVPLSAENANAMLQVTDRLLLAGPNPIVLWVRLGALCDLNDPLAAQELALRYEKVFPKAYAEFVELNDRKKLARCGLMRSGSPPKAFE